MPIVIRAKVPGMTREQYNGMSDRMLQLIKTKKGFIAHAGTAIPGGWEVTEMWESQDAFDDWMKNTVMPAAKAAGIETPVIEVAQAERAISR
jgi:heme-degrading monooxygenase HmoA